MPLFPAPQTADTLRAQHGERYPWLVLLVMALGIISAVLCTTSFAVAIPAMMQRYGIGQEQAQWTMTGFMAAMAVGMLPAPWLLERIGFRKLFLGSSALLLASSLAGALGASWMGFSGIVVVRILQGVAAGVMQPLGTLAVMRLFQPHEQGRASGILGFGIVLAPAVAPSLGGMLLDMFPGPPFSGWACRPEWRPCGWPRAGCRCRARSRAAVSTGSACCCSPAPRWP
nr:MFS transporter [Brachymonas denitrificans]